MTKYFTFFISIFIVTNSGLLSARLFEKTGDFNVYSTKYIRYSKSDFEGTTAGGKGVYLSDFTIGEKNESSNNECEQ